MGNFANMNFRSVSYTHLDYTESVTLPIRYLIANGHRRIAYASGDPLTSAYHYKLLGYQMALEMCIRDRVKTGGLPAIWRT